MRLVIKTPTFTTHHDAGWRKIYKGIYTLPHKKPAKSVRMYRGILHICSPNFELLNEDWDRRRKDKSLECGIVVFSISTVSSVALLTYLHFPRKLPGSALRKENLVTT